MDSMGLFRLLQSDTLGSSPCPMERYQCHRWVLLFMAILMGRVARFTMVHPDDTKPGS